MMERYKLILSNSFMYKEIELGEEFNEVHIGTNINADIRLRKENFFGLIDLTLINTGQEWCFYCSDNLYISVDNISKLLTTKLKHGDSFEIKYHSSDTMVFKAYFTLDFDYVKKDYNLQIDLINHDSIIIGGCSKGDVLLKDTSLGDDYLTLYNNNGLITLVDSKTKYGVYVNGKRMIQRQRLKNSDFFSLNGYSFYYNQNKLYVTESENMIIQHLKYKRVNEYETHFEFPTYYRSTRTQFVVPQEEIYIQQPSQMPIKPSKSLLFSLIPSLAMFVATVILRGLMGDGGTFVIYSIFSMGLGIIMSIYTYIKDNKDYKYKYNERIKHYNEYISNKENEIVLLRNLERNINNKIYECINHDIEMVQKFSNRLFERDQTNNDFLHLYLGNGRKKTVNPVKTDKQEFINTEDPISTLASEIANKYAYIEDCSIIVDLKQSNGVAFIGTKCNLEKFIRNITLDICIRQFYKDVYLTYIVDEEMLEDLRWVRWLHNVYNDSLDINNIACDEYSTSKILENIYSILSLREQEKKENDNKSWPHYIVFVSDSKVISTHPVSNYLKNASEYNFTFVYLQEYREDIPVGCKYIVKLGEENTGTIYSTLNGSESSEFKYVELNKELVDSISRRLGGIDVKEVSLEEELTKNISLFEMMGLLSVDDINLTDNWENSQIELSMAAAIGVKRNNELVYLDISDRPGAHGPHGLVAGTTGSGKSEILQTYILSMALKFHPYEVGFMIIDFKGGGMANQFKNLPHILGTITNIDGREIDRSLLSIKAELIKRQELFSKYQVNHINDYIKLYRNKKITQPLPHLIIIVDEFAELKNEYPDFMKELISAARIGRTLGVHLILATQKPAGIIDSQIWSNSKFKLCLKVQTKEDSNEVLKTPLASEIIEPGRAYFQVGNNEIFDLFQSSYSGALLPVGNDNSVQTYEIYERDIYGRKTKVFSNNTENTRISNITQLESVVDYIHKYSEKYNINKLQGVCLPPLKKIIDVNELKYDNLSLLSVPFGVYDNPKCQIQDQLSLPIGSENTFIVGSSQSGKTVLLQTFLYGILKKYNPDNVNLYLIDCGSMVLKLFEYSNLVGDVIIPNEDEKCKNLFKMLHCMVDERRKLLIKNNVSNYLSYIEAGFKGLPAVVIMIDNMASFKDYYSEYLDDISVLSREGLAVGISFIITSPSSNALSIRTQASYHNRIVLNCIDDSEYSSLLGRTRIAPMDVPGRGLIIHEKEIVEFQTAIFAESSNEVERNNKFKKFIEDKNIYYQDKVKPIRVVPSKLLLEDTLKNSPDIFMNKNIIPIGMNFEFVDFININLTERGSISLLGDSERSCKFINLLIESISRSILTHETQLFIIDNEQRLYKFSKSGFVKKYSNDIEESEFIIEDFIENAMCGKFVNNNYKTILIINNKEVLERISKSKDFTQLLKNATKYGVYIVINYIENKQGAIFSNDIMYKFLKDISHAITFMQFKDIKLYDLINRFSKEPIIDETMAYYIKDNYHYRIKLFE